MWSPEGADASGLGALASGKCQRGAATNPANALLSSLPARPEATLGSSAAQPSSAKQN